MLVFGGLLKSRLVGDNEREGERQGKSKDEVESEEAAWGGRSGRRES